MTAEEQRIAIAEACGWTYWQSKHGHWHVIDPESNSSEPAFGVNWPKFDSETGKRNPPMPWWTNVDLPDYLNDLNAMHEAEKALDQRQQDVFAGFLGTLTGGRQIDYGTTQINATTKILFATAAQRAEAFLRAIGKWTEHSDIPTNSGKEVNSNRACSESVRANQDQSLS